MESGIQSAGDMAVMQSSMPKLGKLGHGNMDKAAKDFESMFMSQMLQPMFESMNVDPMFGGGNGEKIMRGFLVQEYGKIAAKGSHFGIADSVKAEMIRAQSAGTHTTNAGNSISGGQNVATTQSN